MPFISSSIESNRLDTECAAQKSNLMTTLALVLSIHHGQVEEQTNARDLGVMKAGSRVTADGILSCKE